MLELQDEATLLYVGFELQSLGSPFLRDHPGQYTGLPADSFKSHTLSSLARSQPLIAHTQVYLFKMAGNAPRKTTHTLSFSN